MTQPEFRESKNTLENNEKLHNITHIERRHGMSTGPTNVRKIWRINQRKSIFVYVEETKVSFHALSTEMFEFPWKYD